MISDQMLGHTIDHGRYRLIDVLGMGGMGVVYLAEETSVLKRSVAVKTIRTELSDPKFTERFAREAKTIADLDHPYIVRIYAFGSEGDLSYIVMHYLAGGSLKQRLEQAPKRGVKGPSPGETAMLVSHIADALDHAHLRGVIHRDVKPGNIMFDADGHPFLVDFGIARPSQQSGNESSFLRRAYTPNYAAPEQVMRQKSTAKVDQYALGIVAYAMLTGALPFEGDSEEVLDKKAQEDPLPASHFRPNLPPGIDEVLNRALARDPGERFPTASAFAAALSAAIRNHEGEPTGFFSFKVNRDKTRPPTRTTGPTPPTAQPSSPGGGLSKSVWLALGGLVAVIALLSVLIGALLTQGGAAAPPAEAAAAPTSPPNVTPLDAGGLIFVPDATTPAPSIEAVAQTPTHDAPATETREAIRLALDATSTRLALDDLQLTAEQQVRGQTATADAWTLTPGDTPAPAATATSTATETPDPGATQAQETRVIQLAQTQILRDWTATAEAWTDTPTATATEPPIFVSDTPVPSATTASTATETPDPGATRAQETRVIQLAQTQILRDWTATAETWTDTPTATATEPPIFVSDTPVPSATTTPTASATATEPPIFVSDTPVPSSTASYTATVAPTETPTRTLTPTSTPTSTPTTTATLTRTPTLTSTPTRTLTPSPSATATVPPTSTAITLPTPLAPFTSPLPLPAVLRGHTSWVGGVAFSPDGRTLASASDDKTVRLWDTATGEARAVLEGHTSGINYIAFSPDGRTLASASADDTVRLWDTAAGELRAVLEGHTSSVFSVAFSPDGRTLASASVDNTVRLWDAVTGEPRAVLEGHTDWVNAVAFSPDGRTLASASYDGTVRLWDTATGELRAVLEGHTNWVLSVAFSPDGRIVASAGDDGTVRLWDTATGELRAVLRGHTGWIASVAFSPDGRIVASAGDDGTVRLWDAAPVARIISARQAGGGVNVRSAPNPNAFVVRSFSGQESPYARTADSTWLMIGPDQWVSASVVTVQGDISSLPIQGADGILITLTPVATPTPSG